MGPKSLRRQQSTPSRLKDIQRVKILRRKRRHTRRQRAQLRLQATRHVLRRNLIDQTDKIAGLRTEQTVLDAHDARAARTERIEIIYFARIAAQKHGRRTVHGRKVVGDVRERQRGEPVVPVVEDDLAASGDEGVAALLDAEEAGDEVEGGRADVAGEVWEEAEKEAGGAVQEDDFGAVIEIWVLGS